MQALLHHESPGVRQGAAAARGPAASLWAHVPEAVGRGVLGRVRSLWTGVGAYYFLYVIYVIYVSWPPKLSRISVHVKALCLQTCGANGL